MVIMMVEIAYSTIRTLFMMIIYLLKLILASIVHFQIEYINCQLIQMMLINSLKNEASFQSLNLVQCLIHHFKQTVSII